MRRVKASALAASELEALASASKDVSEELEGAQVLSRSRRREREVGGARLPRDEREALYFENWRCLTGWGPSTHVARRGICFLPLWNSRGTQHFLDR